MHQHPPTPAPRFAKQVPRELGGFPRAPATKHGPAARLTEHAAVHPVPRREQDLQRAGRGHRRRRPARLGRVERCLGADASRRTYELGEPPAAVRPNGRSLWGCQTSFFCFPAGRGTDLALERDVPFLRVELVDDAHESRVSRLEDCGPALVLPCDARDERWSYAREVPACAEHAGTQGRERNVRVLSWTWSA